MSRIDEEGEKEQNEDDEITKITKYVIEQSQAIGVDLNEDMNSGAHQNEQRESADNEEEDEDSQS